MTDPAIALVQNLTDPILDAVAAIDVVDNRKFALCPPVGPGHVVEDFPGGTPAQRGSRKSAVFDFEMRQVRAMYGQGKFALLEIASNPASVTFRG